MIFSADPNEVDSKAEKKQPYSMFRHACTIHFTPRQILAEIDPKKFLVGKFDEGNTGNLQGLTSNARGTLSVKNSH